MKTIYLVLILSQIVFAQSIFNSSRIVEIPQDLPIPTITYSNNPSAGYIFAAVPYWGTGNNYLVVYDNLGKPVFYKKTKTTCTDFKLNENGLISYFDYSTKKFYAMDSTMSVVDSFWVKNGYETDPHEIKFLKNGNVLLIGQKNNLVDMSVFIVGGNRNASVVSNVIQELDQNKNVVFEWKTTDHYKYLDAGDQVNLLDQAFLHSHLNSIDLDLDDNIIISSRNLNEITKINRKTGKIIWRFGGKNNQFKFIGDTTKFNSQHSANVLKNGNILLYDNASYSTKNDARAIEYKLDQNNMNATVVWKYSNTPALQSLFWGNVQRLINGNTFIAWGLNDISATEVTSDGRKVFEMKFPKDVYSYRIFKYSTYPKTTALFTASKLPSKISLEQNYPNPFNSSTTINYAISKGEAPYEASLQNVSLKIYDVLGNEVATLVDEPKQPGYHKIIFNIGQNLKIPSGIYFYKLQIGKQTETKKMVLLR